MAGPASVFNIVNGEFALALVNTAALGYLSTWQAPAGKTVATAVIADYTGAANWNANVVSGKLTPRSNITNRRREATFTDASNTTPIAGFSNYTLEADVYQDVHISTGLAKFLFTNDTLEAYFLLGLNNGAAPRAIGRVRVVAGSFGGKAEDDLRDTIRLELTRRPSISFGDATTSVIVGMSKDGSPIFGPKGWRELTREEHKIERERYVASLAASGMVDDAAAVASSATE